MYPFLFDETTGRLTPNAIPTVPQPPDTGPRHYCFHPVLDTVYFSNEQGSSVTAYRLDPSDGTIEAFQTLSTLPEGFEGENTCAQIHMTPDGRLLYVSNRGHDSIAGFRIDPSTGALAPIGQQPTEPTPRAFGIDPQGRFLFAGGQRSGHLASYRIDPATGALTPLNVYPAGQNPMWVMGMAV